MSILASASSISPPAAAKPGRIPISASSIACILDGAEPELLTSADADHTYHLSPDRSCFVATHSRVDLAPVSELRSTRRQSIAVLEKADLDDLFAQGFRFPERFTVKAADGVTDLHGVLYKPSDFDPARRYPVIDDMYPGPQLIRTPKSFCVSPSASFETWPGAWISQSLAELGLVVMNLDGRGTPLRSRAFHFRPPTAGSRMRAA